MDGSVDEIHFAIMRWQFNYSAMGADRCTLLVGAKRNTGAILQTVYNFSYGQDSNPNKYSVKLGVHDSSKSESTQVIANIKSIYVHQDYNPRTAANDIALLKVTQSFILKKTTFCLEGCLGLCE